MASLFSFLTIWPQGPDQSCDVSTHHNCGIVCAIQHVLQDTVASALLLASLKNPHSKQNGVYQTSSYPYLILFNSNIHFDLFSFFSFFFPDLLFLAFLLAPQPLFLCLHFPFILHCKCHWQSMNSVDPKLILFQIDFHLLVLFIGGN